MLIFQTFRSDFSWKTGIFHEIPISLDLIKKEDLDAMYLDKYIRVYFFAYKVM